tara:strand:+ start:626 stop:1120 length:495 start_codon:yes stop_codon:yes gene_type:complete
MFGVWVYSYNSIQPDNITEAIEKDCLISDSLEVIYPVNIDATYKKQISNNFNFWSIKRVKRRAVGFIGWDYNVERNRTLRVDLEIESPFEDLGINSFDIMRLKEPINEIFKNNTLSPGLMTPKSSRGFACKEKDTLELSFLKSISRQHNNQLFKVFSKIKVVVK